MRSKLSLPRSSLAQAQLTEHQLIAFDAHLSLQHPVVLQEGQVRLAERRMHAAGIEQRAQRHRRDRRAGNLAVVDQLLQHGVAEDFAANDAGLDQLEEAVDEHLGAAVQPSSKRPRLAPRQAVGAQALEDAPVLLAVAIAHDQALADGVAQRADADLQRAAVLHQAGGVQADGVVGRLTLLFGGANTACVAAGSVTTTS